MKRKQLTQPGLFDAQEYPLYVAPEQADEERNHAQPDADRIESAALYYAGVPETDNGRDWGDFDCCLTAFGTNACTLDDMPARIIGSPRTTDYATIEPLDLDVDPIRCCWDVVDIAMREGGAFCREDDDTTNNPDVPGLFTPRFTPVCSMHHDDDFEQRGNAS